MERILQHQINLYLNLRQKVFCKLTFGGGNISAEEQLKEFARDGKGFDLSRYTNNYAMGAALTPNTTLFVQYRIGGGFR